jgi:hypothetical protein
MALVLMASVLGTGSTLVGFAAWAAEQAAKTAPGPAETGNGKKLKALLMERRASAKERFDWSKGHAFDARAAEGKGRERERQARGRRLPPELRDPGTPDFGALLQVLVLDTADSQAQLYQWARRLLIAEEELSDNKAERVAAYEAHLQRMKEVEDFFKKQAGDDETDRFAAEAKFHRLEAEIMLERARQTRDS